MTIEVGESPARIRLVLLTFIFILSACTPKAQQALINSFSQMSEEEFFQFWDKFEEDTSENGDSFRFLDEVSIPGGGKERAYRVRKSLEEYAEFNNYHALGDLPILATDDSYYKSGDIVRHTPESAINILQPRWFKIYSRNEIISIVDSVYEVSEETGIPPAVFFAIIDNERGNADDPCKFASGETETLASIRDVGHFIRDHYLSGTDVGEKIDLTSGKFNNYYDYAGTRIRTLGDAKEIIKWMRVVEVFCNSGSKPGVMFSRLGEDGVVKDHLSFSYLYSHKEIDYSDNAKLKEQRQKFIHFFTTYGGGVELSEINRVINDTRKLDVIFPKNKEKFHPL